MPVIRNLNDRRMAWRGLSAALLSLGLLVAPAGGAEARLPADGFVDLAEKLTPVAVTINTAASVSSPKRNAPELEPGNPFGEFFKDFFDRGPEGGPRRMESQGSGFVIDDGRSSGRPGASKRPFPSTSTKIGFVKAKGVKPGSASA